MLNPKRFREGSIGHASVIGGQEDDSLVFAALPFLPVSTMPLFRRARLLGPSNRAVVSTSALQLQSATLPTSLPPQTRRGLFGRIVNKDAAIARMKEAARLALEVVQTALGLAGDATSDVAVPGLSVGLKALAEILRKVQTMDTTISGVQELHERVVDLVDALHGLHSHSGDQPIPVQMLDRMAKQEEKWQRIASRAEKIKAHGKIKRFFTSDTDAKALQGLVDEMNRSVQDDMLEGVRNIEMDVRRIRQGMEAVSTNVEIVQEGIEVIDENVEMVREGVEEVLVGMEAAREELEDIGEDVGVVLQEIAAVRGGVSGVGEDVEAVRLGVQVVEDGVEALHEGVDVVVGNIEALRDKVEAVDANVQQLQLQVAKAIAATLDKSFLPMYAKMAPYNSNEVRRSCLEGTRVDFLNRIYARITAVLEQGATAPDGGIVLWVNGLGGTGKTTVAHTVCEWCDDPQRRILAGSFFCSGADNDCSDPSLVFPSLCRQLCEHHQPYKDQVEEVLQRIPDVASYGLYSQFEELIVRPLEALNTPFPRSVFVLDALDELKDKAAKSTILLVIAKFVSRIAKFLLLIITSRPEERITVLFEAKRRDSLKDTTTPLLMHDIPIDVALRDIRRFLDYEFADNIGVAAIPEGWPSDAEKAALANQSQGLFIYVVTAMKFVLDKAHGDPKGRLGLLVNALQDSSEPQEFLSSLYSAVVAASYENAARALVDRIQKVLGAVVLAQEPLSPSSLSRLLGFGEESIRNALTRLHSVLYVPTDSDKPIHIIHPTFPEFLLRSPNAMVFEPADSSSVPVSLRIPPAEQHWYLFSRCLEVMSRSLKRDMIGIRYPAMWRSEVENLEERIAAAIGPHVRYACRFWADHLRDGAGCAASLDVSALFWKFVHKLLLYWIETCSLLDSMDKVIFALDIALNVCQMLGGQFADLAPLLADCRRFAATYSPSIHAAPLQIYHSALSLSPTASHVRTTYSHEREHALVVEHGAHADWAPCLDTFAGHGGQPVLGVAFAPDGSCFVTSGGDHKARIWKTATRTPVLAFGYIDLCVAFSPDGLHVASGGDANRVFVWQALSGDRVRTLERLSAHSLAYSGDGRRILSAIEEGEVKLWDAADGRCLLTLRETGRRTLQVGISPDGDVIVRGVRGSGLSMYNVSTAASETLKFPDKVEACTFSPDGRYIAARSWYIIRVWHWPDKSLVRSIDVSDKLSSPLAFSRDGTLIGCGSSDGPVHLWKVASQDPPCTLQGHTDHVKDLAFSPDHSQVVSVADDGMIRVWDRTLSSIASAEHTAPAPPMPTPGPPRFALVRSGGCFIALLHLPTLGIDAEHFGLGAQMPDGAPTATLFPDAASAWDTALQHLVDRDGSRSSRVWTSLVGGQHSQLSRRPFAISHDGSLMVYPSPASDKVVNICDLRTGTVVATLIGHTDDVCSIAFSPDSTRIATGSSGPSLKVWDTLSGTLVCDHTEYCRWASTYAVAFSLDSRLVALGSADHTVRIFEVAAQRVVHVLGSHRNGVTSVMFAADNIHVVVFDWEDGVHVWDATTGARLRGFSLGGHDHLHDPVFSLDDTGISINGEDGTLHTVRLWQPGTRAWPAYHITQDGWVYALSPGKSRRLVLLPPEWRTLLRSDGSRLYVGETKLAEGARRRVIILNMSRIEAYIDSLDTSS